MPVGLWEIVGGLMLLLIGFALGWLWMRARIPRLLAEQQRRIALLEEEREHLRQGHRELTEKLESAESELAAQQAAYHTAERKAAVMEADIAHLRQKIQEQRADFDRALEQMRREIEQRWQIRLQHVEEQLAEAQHQLREKEQLADQKAQLEVAVETAHKEIELLKSRIADQARQIEQIGEQARREAAERWQLKVKHLEERLAKADDELQRLRRIEEEKHSLEARLEGARKEAAMLKRQMDEQQQEFKRMADHMRQEFEALAQKILEEKSEKFTRYNREQLGRLLEPLQDQLKDFRKRIEETDKAHHGRIEALKEQLRQLHAASQRLSEEALALTRALKGQSQTQGAWGEMILESILEHSGLTKGQEYVVQESMTDEEGKRHRPDVIVHLPDNKRLVIDAKVSLSAYERYVNATADKERNEFLKQHVQSIRRHIADLEQRNYQDLFDGRSPDFVLMFIPLEPAFSVALQHDQGLYSMAFDKRIVLVSPTTLLATLRIVHSMWQTEKQRRNAAEIARRAGRLYDKFVGFYETLQEIGRRIGQLQQAYDTAEKQLKSGRGNIFRQMEQLRHLGARTSKRLPSGSVDFDAFEEGDQPPTT